MTRFFPAIGFILFGVLVCPAPGQNATDLFSKAPPDVDEALRARVSKFFQAQVEGKFRQAERYVAEESRDAFYEMKKTKYPKYEIRTINYSDNFTQAMVLVLVETFMPLPGFEGKPVPMPLKTTWKIVDGEWYWYMDPAAAKLTPFGQMTPGPPMDPNAKPGAPGSIPQANDAQALLHGLQVDKRTVLLKSKEASSDRITFVNGLPATVSLRLNPVEFPGLEIKFEPVQMKRGEKAVAFFHFEPKGAAPPAALRIYIVVDPLNYVIPVGVNFQ